MRCRWSGERRSARVCARRCKHSVRKGLMAIGLAALWGSGAQAAQITFGPSNQSITFTGNGANSVAVSSPTLTGSAFDPTNGLVGSFTLSALSFSAGPQNSGIFLAGANTETFTY